MDMKIISFNDNITTFKKDITILHKYIDKCKHKSKKLIILSFDGIAQYEIDKYLNTFENVYELEPKSSNHCGFHMVDGIEVLFIDPVSNPIDKYLNNSEYLIIGHESTDQNTIDTLLTIQNHDFKNSSKLSFISETEEHNMTITSNIKFLMELDVKSYHFIEDRKQNKYDIHIGTTVIFNIPDKKGNIEFTFRYPHDSKNIRKVSY